MYGSFSVWDKNLFITLNSLAGRSFFLDQIYIFFAVGLAFIMALLVVLYWFIHRDKMRARLAIIEALLSLVLARFVVVEVIRGIWARNRPFVAETHVNQLIELLHKGSEPSFPSGHASAMFAVALTIYFYNKKLGFFFLALAAVTGISRVIVGVHYPSDIIGGILVGLAISWLVHKKIAAHLQILARRISNASDNFFRQQ